MVALGTWTPVPAGSAPWAAGEVVWILHKRHGVGQPLAALGPVPEDAWQGDFLHTIIVMASFF